MNKQNKNSKEKTQTTKAKYSKVIHICCRTNKTLVCLCVCVFTSLYIYPLTNTLPSPVATI